MARAVVLSFFLALWPSLTSAIVIRHDIDPGVYVQSATAYPAIFSLYRTSSGHPDCLATLIHAQWAITAAHCTEEDALTRSLTEGFRVQVGGRPASVDRVIRHSTADVALLHFSQPIRSTAPMKVYRSGDELGRTVLIPGWGQTGNGVSGLGVEDGVFRVAENRVDAARDGLLIWRFDDPRSGLQGALALEGISGPGDSGGPAIIVGANGSYVAGISSSQRIFAPSEGRYGVEEQFVRVSEYIDWIDAIVPAVSNRAQ